MFEIYFRKHKKQSIFKTSKLIVQMFSIIEMPSALIMDIILLYNMDYVYESRLLNKFVCKIKTYNYLKKQETRSFYFEALHKLLNQIRLKRMVRKKSLFKILFKQLLSFEQITLNYFPAMNENSLNKKMANVNRFFKQDFQ